MTLRHRFSNRVRRLLPGLTVLSVLGGTVLARFDPAGIPTKHLLRAMVAVAMVSLVAGIAAAVAKSWWPAIAIGLLTVPSEWGLLVCLVALAVVMAIRMRRSEIDVGPVVATVATVFFVSGIVASVPHIRFPVEPADMGGPPTYVVLLDAYPRADTLEELGIDISPFIRALQDRGFDHYPEARSLNAWTHLTLLAATTGEVKANPTIHPPPGQLAEVREKLRLPPGFATIGPAFGYVSIPGAYDISGGFTALDMDLIRSSVAGLAMGDFVMDRFRSRLDRDLETLAVTTHKRVFAHLSAPHQPYLYDVDGSPLSAPDCWPCDLTFGQPADPRHLGGTIRHLNEGLLEAIDRILVRHPDARFVLVADHGARLNMEGEWSRVFFAARTPGRPLMFVADPRSDRMFEVVDWYAAQE